VINPSAHLRIAFIGDIVGKPGRNVVKHHLHKLRSEYNVDFVIANGENISHGFGCTIKNANEMFEAGVDLITGGNHSFDKKDILPFLDKYPIIRPVNFPDETYGKGWYILEKEDEKLAVINLMGFFSMPLCDNPFTKILSVVKKLKEDGIKNIFIDFHAEATAEKRTLLSLLRGQVAAICGTHTHIGTDDMVIEDGTFYVTDVGLSGCMDGIIGMEEKAPIKRSTLCLHESLDIPKKCKKIFQTVVFDIENGKTTKSFKLKALDEQALFVSQEAILL
jgi:metallophosphoesterase (TIGR00282 family)